MRGVGGEWGGERGGGGGERGGGGREGYLSNSDLNGAVANRKWLGALHHQSQGKGM